MPDTNIRLLLLKSGPGSGKKIAHQSGMAFWGGRWHKITPDKPAPHGAPVAHHHEAAGKFSPAKHFSDDEWAALKLPASNTNADSHNKKIDQIKELSEGGHVTGLLGLGLGSNTYSKKQALVINHLLALHGSTHTVTAGQKAGTHGAVQAGPAAGVQSMVEAIAQSDAAPEHKQAAIDAVVKQHAKTEPAPAPAKKITSVGPALDLDAASTATKDEIVAGKIKNLKFDSSLKNEAEAGFGSGVIRVGEKFFALEPIARKHVLAHEQAHYDADKIGLSTSIDLADAGVFGKQSADGSLADGPGGQWKPDEALTESLALYQTDPDHLKQKYPDAYAVAEAYYETGKLPQSVVDKVEKVKASKAASADAAGAKFDAAEKAIKAKIAGASSVEAKAKHQQELKDLLVNDIYPDWLSAAGPLTMPEFQEGKTTTGVKALYEKTGQKIIDHGHAGNVSVLEGMPDPTKKMWHGRTPNSKKLLALHAAAMAHAKGEKPAEADPLAVHDTPASKVLHVIPSSDPKAGYEVHIATPKSAPGSKYSVVVKDVDSGEFLPAVKVFSKESDALEHAHALADGKKPDTGPKEGDTKPGADGSILVLKDGHWVKQGGDAPAVVGLSPEEIPPSDVISTTGKATVAEANAAALSGDLRGLKKIIADLDHPEDQTYKPLVHAKKLLALLEAKKPGAAAPVAAKGDVFKLDSQYEKMNAGEWQVYNVSPDGQQVYMHKVGATVPNQKNSATIPAATLAEAIAKGTAKKQIGASDLDSPEDMAADYAKAVSLAFPKTASHIKAVAQYMGVDTSDWSYGSTPASAPVQPPAAAPAAASGIPAMDSWVQTGGQGGSNPGGKYKDPDGQEWYCKFPGDADTAKSEVLAAKLYALAGLSGQDAKLITKDGKIGIASKWVNIKKASSPSALAKVDGVLSGFAVDAWLGNWDVIGMSLDNTQIGPDGKAHRVDAGGSLEYRAQGEKKPFGNKVEELDTLLDAKKNPHSAAVFKGMTEADLIASVAKVAAISDVAIRAMVNQFGPGDADAKKKLADTLIARKQDLLKKFPQAAKAKKKHVFKPEKISSPPSFLNWGGSGKSGPSSKEFLNKANEDAVQAIFAAAKTGDMDAVKKLTAPVFDKDTGQVTGHKPVLEHPSQHVKGYAQQAINEINYQLNPPKRFRFDGGHPLHALNAAYPSHTGAKSSSAAQKLGKFLVLGDPGIIKLEDAGLPEKIKHAEGGGTLSQQTYKAQAHAAWNKMPKTQQDAIKAYTGSSYHKMNGSLWDGNPTGAAKAAAEALHTLGHDITPGTVLSRKLSIHGDDLQALLNAKGKILQEPAIMSTAIRPSSWSGNVQLKLHVGPGVKGLWVGPGSQPGGGAISVNSGEDEMLLPPNTRLMIISSSAPKGKDADGFGGGSMHVIEAVVLPT